MMKFKIGETIIEPTNGICVVRGMKKMTVDGKEMVVYILDAQNAKVFVPADQIEKRNIRRPMDREDVKKVLAALKQPVSPNRNDARLQYNNYRDIMKSGDPQKITRLLRDLYILDEADDLKGKEKEIMEQAKKFLCDEIAFVRNASKIQVMETVNEALRQMYKKKMTRDKERAKKSGVGLPMAMLGYEDDEAPEDEELEIVSLAEADDLDEAIEKSAQRKKKTPEKKKRSSILDDDDAGDDEGDEEEEELADEDEGSTLGDDDDEGDDDGGDDEEERPVKKAAPKKKKK